VVNLIAVTTLLLMSGLHRCWQRTFKKNTNYFYAVRISISLAILSEIFIQIGYFSKSYGKKTKVDVFFLNMYTRK